ncbi:MULTISPECIES: hypothetical protein [Psychrilyobacter]|uniref:Uncharacterized protein n=1 Tax=Psychrilyobacter piezotolerans TaxID=2293438 RepID=A0ABX9KJR5_9FUSO|nr:MULTISPECIES: hypothetical protein [Psychrilyobacter]MCS5421267.1 hypothetical protein [Psychrilyobacter sp. S5]NDI76976.1 hypothetical protein [Psychrilyobacter piezotolerans]RDE64592.1 hypothetical protein DV867_03365 [Psychrilyobacter sp. S5]REI42404.1 hypothetical protein DYH56_03365 [Psychrilyobacter piezotolerans]
MNWKKQKKIRLCEMQALEEKRKDLAKVGWLAMNKKEKEQLRKLINFSWDKIPGYAKAKISKDDYIKFETQEHCVKFAEKLKK